MFSFFLWNLWEKTIYLYNDSSLPLFVFRKLRFHNLHVVGYRSPGTDGGVASNDPPSFDKESEEIHIYIYIYSTLAPQGLF